MARVHSHGYATPLGTAFIEETDGALTRVAMVADSDGLPDHPSALTNTFANELLEYLAGKRQAFSVACAPEGTPFQRAVWCAIQAIPYGQVRTCTDIAQAIGQANARRQVGRAAAACPCPIAVPVHRVSSLDDALSVRLRTLEQGS